MSSLMASLMTVPLRSGCLSFLLNSYVFGGNTSKWGKNASFLYKAVELFQSPLADSAVDEPLAGSLSLGGFNYTQRVNRGPSEADGSFAVNFCGTRISPWKGSQKYRHAF